MEFDMELAKRGEKVRIYYGEKFRDVHFVGPSDSGRPVIQCREFSGGVPTEVPVEWLSMKPKPPFKMLVQAYRDKYGVLGIGFAQNIIGNPAFAGTLLGEPQVIEISEE